MKRPPMAKTARGGTVYGIRRPVTAPATSNYQPVFSRHSKSSVAAWVLPFAL